MRTVPGLGYSGTNLIERTADRLPEQTSTLLNVNFYTHRKQQNYVLSVSVLSFVPKRFK